MKSTTHYLLAAFAVVSLLILGTYIMVRESHAQSASQNIPSNNSPIVSNANFSLMCGVVQDQTGTQRQKVILLDNRTGQCKSLEQNQTSEKFEWIVIH